MQPDTDEVPLFPLQVVLYPTIATRLQVFEQRYLRLIRESMSGDKPFGVVPITRGTEAGGTPEIFPWGTLVRVQDWDQLPNGLLGVVIKGEQRLHVLETRVEEDGLMFAQARVFESEPEEPPTFAEDGLIDALETLARHMGVANDTFMKDLAKATLVWRLAGVLPVQPELKMSLLAMDNVDARLVEVKKWLLELRMRRASKT